MRLFLVRDVKHILSPEVTPTVIDHTLGMPTPSPEETSDSGTLLGVFENVPERNLGESPGLMVSEQVGVCPAQPGKAGQSTAAHQGNLPGVSTGLGGLHVEGK